MYDVVIIGAGVSGSACAMHLSKYDAKVCVLEKEEDVCCGTSKANSAIVHAGFDAETGSLMAKLNVQGNLMMPQLCKDLDIPFIKNGSLVVCTNKEDLPNLQKLYERGIANGVKELRILNREELKKLEPNISDGAIAALYAPTAGIVDPFILNIAMAELAYVNGVQFKFNTKVLDFENNEQIWTIKTNKGNIKTKYIVNAAGVYADVLHNKVSDKKIKIVARRGDYCLLDKSAGMHVSKTIFMLPSKFGKGILVTPTVHGNLLVGPTAIDIENKEGTNTTKEGLDSIIEKSSLTVKNIPFRDVITSFAGLRAHEQHHEFIIEEIQDAPGFIDCSGIESPGLTSCPAIGLMVKDIVCNLGNYSEKEHYETTRKGIVNVQNLNDEELSLLIKKNPKYAQIICRCESISEGEIVDAINRPLGAKSLDGVKRRVRAGMGRCQSGFCSPKVMQILARELNIDVMEITKSGNNSFVLAGKNKEDI